MAGQAATAVPVDAEAEAARVVPAGRVATAVNPANRVSLVSPASPVDNYGRGTAQTMPEPIGDVEKPRVGRDMCARHAPASEGDRGLSSRSAGLQRAIRMLRYPSLEDDYAKAWGEWSASGEDEVWEQTVGDGLRDASR
jgi:hypothetical protein